MNDDYIAVNPQSADQVFTPHNEGDALPSEHEKNMSILAGLIVFFIFLAVVFYFAILIEPTKTASRTADNQLSSFGQTTTGNVAGANTKSPEESFVSIMPTPSLSPTPTETPSPTASSTPTPSPEPSPEPTSTPTPEPTFTPTPESTVPTTSEEA